MLISEKNYPSISHSFRENYVQEQFLINLSGLIWILNLMMISQEKDLKLLVVLMPLTIVLFSYHGDLNGLL